MVLMIAAVGLVVASTIGVMSGSSDLILVESARSQSDAGASMGVEIVPITNEVGNARASSYKLSKASAARITSKRDKVTKASGPHATLVIAR